MEYFLAGIYLLVLVYTLVRIILDTQSTPKTLAYILLVIIFPLGGIFIYFSFGINYRHRSARGRGMTVQKKFDEKYLSLKHDPGREMEKVYSEDIGHFSELVQFLENMGHEYLQPGRFELLINGERKYPKMLEELSLASSFIHMEYYAWENDQVGNAVKEVLKRKAAEGVEVRVLFDDYASRGIRGNIVRELKEAGVQIYPQIKVKFQQFANRLNHRDHRKIIVIDGIKGFVGGINLSDRYDNSVDTGLYWRDTHVLIKGSLVSSLQRHFVVSWNACENTEKLEFNYELFPEIPPEGQGAGQFVAGGPIYPDTTIMLSYLRVFTLAREKLYITNPYFIPSESILDALRQAAYSGVDVRILLPDKSDSALVGAASRFYFTGLIKAGVKIYLYQKGFIHSKTLVADGMVSIVGTANMDIRSFDLNFEIMPVLYSRQFAGEMEQMFLRDLENSKQLTLKEVESVGTTRKLLYATARLISSFL